MRTLFSGISSNIKHTIDFSLVPVAIIFIEFSVFITQLTSNSYGSLGNLILLRFIHTVAMIFVSTVVSRVYIWLNQPALSYRTLALTGVLVLAFGDLTHAYLASALNIELISIYRRLGIIGLQGILWFPAFMIIASNRKEIVQQFKAYEQRLIVATRLRSRTSQEFVELQKEIQERIRAALLSSCKALKDAIMQISVSKINLAEQNQLIQPLLTGEDLRKLSMNLDTLQPSPLRRTTLGRNSESLNLLLQQFRVLYASSVRLAPLRKATYALVLIALVSPPYINFYSITEFLFSFPILVVITIIFTNLITKSQSRSNPNSLLMSSILIFATGLLPFVVNLLGQAIYHDPQTRFPILVTGLVLPLTYYLSMEILQILRPSALSLVRNDELEASQTLQSRVNQIVSDEFSQNLSHQWAVFIHGKILTRLAASSLKLEAAAKQGDVQTFNATVDSLLSMLRAPDVEFEQQTTDLQTELANRLDPWQGLLDIDLKIDQNLKSIRNSRVRDIGEVTEELISNSIRHGKAKEIALTITRLDESNIQIVAVDNALVAPQESAQRTGLGTRIFNLASDGRWSLKRVGLTTEFRLTMAIEN
jgi:two-component sensor histidine kinase